MAIDLKPMRWDWAAVTQGDTLPAINLVDTAATFALTRVLVTIEPKDSDVAALTLDSSTTGVTINVATAGAVVLLATEYLPAAVWLACHLSVV